MKNGDSHADSMKKDLDLNSTNQSKDILNVENEIITIDEDLEKSF